MAYLAILDTQLDPDAPITSGLGYQFRDNPLEIASGGDGAPRVVSRALNMDAAAANGTFTIASGAAVSVNKGSPGLDVILCQVVGNYTSGGTGVLSIVLQGSNDNSSWTSLATIDQSLNIDSVSSAEGFVVYTGASPYQWYRIIASGTGNKTLVGSISMLFIGGDTT